MEKDRLLSLLEIQYGTAFVTKSDEVLPEKVKVFHRKEIEGLFPLPDGDTLELRDVILDSNFKPIFMEWRLRRGVEETEKLRKAGEMMYFSYLIAGEHSDKSGAEKTVIMRSVTKILTGETVFGETVAEYNPATEIWEYQ